MSSVLDNIYLTNLALYVIIGYGKGKRNHGPSFSR